MMNLASYDVADRLVFPALELVRYAVREMRYRDGSGGMIEQTVHDYAFSCTELEGWRLEYSGRLHPEWEHGGKLFVRATIVSLDHRYRCLRFNRPVLLSGSDTPLLDGDW